MQFFPTTHPKADKSKAGGIPMTVTEIDTTPAVAAAAAIVRCLPAADLLASDALQGVDALQQAIPAPGSVAVSAALNGSTTHGTILIVLAQEIATQVENGPVGPQDLVAASEPALSDATAALNETFGDLKVEAPIKLDADVALSNARKHDHISVVPMLGNVAVAGALVILLKDGPNPNIRDTTAEGASFEALPNTDSMIAGATRAVELLNDVEMGVTAELGRTRMTVRDLLSLQPGSIVELDRAAGSPVDLLVNGTLVARGEVVVVDEEFAIRITEIIGYDAKKIGQ